MREYGEINLEKLREHLQELEDVLDDGSEYPFFLVTIGEKYGAVSMNTSDKQIQILKKFCNELDLEYRIGEGRVSKPSRKTTEKTKRKQKAFFVSRNDSHFEMLKEGRFYGYSDRSVGEFLGFPEKSIEFFIENEQPAMKSRKQISEMREKESFEADLKYLNLVTFIPAPEQKEVRKAVEKGRERADKLTEFDEETGSDLGEKFIEKRMSKNLYR